MIDTLKAPWRDPPILGKRAPAKPNVVACAIAMSRREKFESDAKALVPRALRRGTRYQGACGVGGGPLGGAGASWAGCSW